MIKCSFKEDMVPSGQKLNLKKLKKFKTFQRYLIFIKIQGKKITENLLVNLPLDQTDIKGSTTLVQI